MKTKRVFLIVLDSVGIGELPDAADYKDVGSNTLKVCYETGNLKVPNMEKLGLFHICGNEYGRREQELTGSFARMAEKSRGNPSG